MSETKKVPVIPPHEPIQEEIPDTIEPFLQLALERANRIKDLMRVDMPIQSPITTYAMVVTAAIMAQEAHLPFSLAFAIFIAIYEHGQDVDQRRLAERIQEGLGGMMSRAFGLQPPAADPNIKH